jgi:RHS repeat-associated protein
VNGTITNYIYDGPNIVTQYDGSWNVTAQYTHTLEVDDPLTVTQGANTYYYHTDGLGSVVNLTDGSGNNVMGYVYTSFGEIYSQTGSLIQPFTFTAREYDPESGLYYYRARYYDPRAGKFLTKDPIGFPGGDVNLYRYAQNNPVNRIDAFGLAQAVFNGSSISLWTDTGRYLGTWAASSGRGGNVNEVGLGPIPSGLYVAEPGSTQTASIFSPVWYFFRQEIWGTQRLSLIPYPGTKTYGRSGFFIHGGSHSQTAGCVRIPNERSFFEAWENTHEILWLTVVYGGGK